LAAKRSGSYPGRRAQLFDMRQNAEDILIKLGEVEVPENAFDNWTAE
jgi:hypothetical protein